MKEKIKIRLRKANRKGIEDAKAIAEIEFNSGYRWGESMKNELKIAKRMLKHVSYLYIAEHEKKPAAYSALTIRDGIAGIDFLSVKKKYHGKGIGTRVLDYAIKKAKKNKKVSIIEIAVWAKNYPAISLYIDNCVAWMIYISQLSICITAIQCNISCAVIHNKFGFYVSKIKRGYYPNGDDKLVMKKMLK